MAELADAVDSKSTDPAQNTPENQANLKQGDPACATLAQPAPDDDLRDVLALWDQLTPDRRRLIADMARTLAAGGKL